MADVMFVYCLTLVAVVVSLTESQDTWLPANCSPSCDCKISERPESLPRHLTRWMKMEDCSRRQMKEPPSVIPEDTQVLILDGNLINDSRVLTDRVVKLQNLSELSISKNELENFDSDKSVLTLHKLVADNNKLSEVSLDIFTTFPYLNELSLLNNEIRGFAKNVCSQQTDMKVLKLDFNKMEDFSWIRNCSALELLEILSIGGNRWKNNIISAGTLNSLQNLQILVMDEMEIVKIKDDAFFGLTNLETIDLADNKIEVVPTAALLQLPKLRYLNLNGNHIKQLHPGSFQNLPNLHTIELTDLKQLSIIDEGAFTNLPTLETLLLFFNPKLAYISRHAFDRCPELATIDLLDTMLETVYQDIVESLPSLRHLILKGNPINCNCMTSWVKQLSADVAKDVDGKIETGEDVVCANPPNLRGNPLTDFDEETCSPAVQPTFPLHIVITENEALTLKCRAFGNPEPTIIWFLPDGTLINNSTEAKQPGMSLDKYGTLTIENPKSGEYICAAQNQRGMNSRAVDVVFSSSAKFPSTATAGTTATTQIAVASEATELATSAVNSTTSVSLINTDLSTSALPLTMKSKSTNPANMSTTILSTIIRSIIKHAMSPQKPLETETITLQKPKDLFVPDIQIKDVAPTNALVTWTVSSDFIELFHDVNNCKLQISLAHNDRLLYLDDLPQFSVIQAWEFETQQFNITHLVPSTIYKCCLKMDCRSPFQRGHSCKEFVTKNRLPATVNNTAIIISILVCLSVLAGCVVFALFFGRHCQKPQIWKDTGYVGLDDNRVIKEETPFNDIFQPLIQDGIINNKRKPRDKLLDTSSSTAFM
ncbi:uncharacterized protein LOC143470298 [Clavelina lepadiformis]|uniref:Ig-like domain-containing protein n=1 Tax=Clavelina lepadiformis TaxID=159417 RepID=A0ABP0FT58_CLALP